MICMINCTCNRRRRRKQESKEIGNIIQNKIARPLVRKTLHPFIHPFICSSIHPSKENGSNHGKGLVFNVLLTLDYLPNLCKYLVSQAVPLFVMQNWSSPYHKEKIFYRRCNKVIWTTMETNCLVFASG
jgi:hypothetical protein